MQAFVSLWSADLLDLGRAVDLVDDLVDGFHIDVFDGHNVDELLFGPDLVAALRRRTGRIIDVHLNVTDPDHWIDRFAAVGADVITVQSGPCPDVEATLGRIRDSGCRAGLGLEVHEATSVAAPRLAELDRLLLLGTEIGVKGRQLHPDTPRRVGELIALRKAATGSAGTNAPAINTSGAGSAAAIIVDGGIRKHTVPLLAQAGADGVIPGSLVFGETDPRAAVQAIRSLAPGQRELDEFWQVSA